ncbi:MAG: TolC family protein [Candidatus Sumerlaeia bacterium]
MRIQRRFAQMVLTVVLSGICVFSSAQQPSGQAGRHPTSETQLVEVPQLDVNKGVQLGLSDVVSLTLANNPNIQISRLAVSISVDDVERAKGIYDPVFRALVQRDNSEKPTGFSPSAISSAGAAGDSTAASFGFSLDEAQITETTLAQVGITQLLPLGTQLEVKFIHRRLDYEDSRRSSPIYINPAHFAEAVVSLRQPLLKNFGWFVTNAGISIARRNREISEQDLRGQIISQLSQVARTYWDLAFAIENYKARLVSLRLAEDLYRVNEARYRAGVRPITDVLQARAEVASRESAVIAAYQTIENLQDALIQQMHLGHVDKSRWQTPIFPSDAPTSQPISLDDEAFIAEALQKRPEFNKALTALDIARIQERVARNQRLPELNAFGSYGFLGDGAEEDGAWDDVEDHRWQEWAVGMEFIYAIPNRKARAEYRQSQRRREQSELSRDALEELIIQDVRRSTRAVRNALVQIGVSESRLKFEDEKLRSQEKRYEVGLATAFELLDFQEDYTEAQVALYRSLSEYEKAKIDLAVARGTVLEVMGVEIRPSSN